MTRKHLIFCFLEFADTNLQPDYLPVAVIHLCEYNVVSLQDFVPD